MKKLMIAAAIVCAAALAQAASCNWNTEWIYAVDTSHPSYDPGGFSGKYWILAGDFSDVSVTAGGVLNAKGTFDTIADGVALTSSDGVFGSIQSLSEADNGKALAMVVYYGGEDGEYWGMDTDMIQGIQDADPGQGKTGSDAVGVTFYTLDQDGYKSMGATTKITTDPTPEPTTGLLMLVGLAGLALRRKRA